VSTRISVNPELLTWARERAGLDTLALAGRLPKLSEWEAGELQPTLRQLEDFARAVLSSTLEGQTLFQDAFRMLGVRKTSTFYEAAREPGGNP